MKKAPILSLLIILLLGLLVQAVAFSQTKAAAKRSKTLIGYAVPGDWHRQDPNVLGRALYENGLNFTVIELAGHENDYDQTLPKLKNFVETMRQYQITTEVVLCNHNGPCRANSTEWFREVLSQVKASGPDQVLVLPISEPFSMKGDEPGDPGKIREWIELTFQEIPASHIVINANENDAAAAFESKAAYREKHWCKPFHEHNIKTGNIINSSDCHGFLNPGPRVAKTVTAIAVRKNAHFLIYDYDRGRPGHEGGIDLATIKAMGSSI